MSAAPGVVYYLNGQNNNLSYEKEVKDNGLIEHKHYLSAGGIVFAMQITRSGNLATGGTGGSAKPASTLQYLHHDHLGSVSVITNETVSVLEKGGRLESKYANLPTRSKAQPAPPLRLPFGGRRVCCFHFVITAH